MKFIDRFFLVSMLCAGIVSGQDVKKSSLTDKLFGKNLRFIANPIVQNSPETGIKMGLAGNYLFTTGNDSLTRSSNIYAQIAYTTKQQFIFEPIWNVFTPAEKFILRGRAGYLDFTDHFWGVGPMAEEQSKSNLSYRRIYLQSKILRKLRGNWFAGLQMRYSNIYSLNWLGEIPEVEGNAGSVVSGMGPNVQADFRNNPFSPQNGWYADVYFARFGNIAGGTHRFDEIQADIRYYLPLKQPFQILAFQLFGNFTFGNVPFRELPRLGSSFLMRGYFEGRFRDFNYLAGQVEWRQPIYKWLHASAFMSAGEVASGLESFSSKRIKSAAGIGLRILLNKKESVFARFDFALNNQGGHGFYIRINDAF
jgi:outer membrane protein assembly factor BamA